MFPLLSQLLHFPSSSSSLHPLLLRSLPTRQRLTSCCERHQCGISSACTDDSRHVNYEASLSVNPVALITGTSTWLHRGCQTTSHHTTASKLFHRFRLHFRSFSSPSTGFIPVLMPPNQPSSIHRCQRQRCLSTLTFT